MEQIDIVQVYGSSSDSDSDNSEKLVLKARELTRRENEKYENFQKEEVTVIENCKDENLKNALMLNRNKKLMLQKIEKTLQDHLKNINTQLVQLRTASCGVLSQHKKVKYRLGMPYFKDRDMFGCPYNEEYEQMKLNKELPLQLYSIPKIWTQTDKYKLAQAVFKHVCRMKKAELTKQLEINKKKLFDQNFELVRSLEHEISNLENENVICDLAGKWNTLTYLNDEDLKYHKLEIQSAISYKQNELQTLYPGSYNNNEINELKRRLNELELRNYIIHTVAFWDKKIDWFDISVNEMQERHPDAQCKFMWEQYLNPRNSKKCWSDADNNKLKNLVGKYNCENWQSISEEMNNNKTAYQCCVHFFSKIYDKFRRDKWSKDEEDYLISVIDICRIGNYIPWGKVSKFFEDRDKHQIYMHYNNCVIPEKKKGQFNLAEDILLKSLIKYHKSFVKASYYFPDRTIVQLRDRYKTLYSSGAQGFTLQDDMLILKHVQDFGECYWKLVPINKSPACIRHRYNILQKWIGENPGKSIEYVTRRMASKESRTKQITKICLTNAIMEILVDKLQNGEHHEDVFNITLIQKLIRDTPISRQEKIVFTGSEKRTRRSDCIDICTSEFFKPCFKFVGRAKMVNDEVIMSAIARVKFLLDILKVNLEIPNKKELIDNPLLDDLDVSILLGLSNESKTICPSNEINLPSTSSGLTNNIIKYNIPPEPSTLIGFRGLMLHIPTLKHHAIGRYDINNFLPTNSQFDIPSRSYNGTKILIKQQISQIPKKEREDLIRERLLCMKRFETIFKWPAIMSMPYNKPLTRSPFIKELSENEPKTKISKPKLIDTISINSDTESNSDTNTENSQTSKQLGRPKKISKKVLLMVEAKKKKRKLSDEEISDNSKKICLESTSANNSSSSFESTTESINSNMAKKEFASDRKRPVQKNAFCLLPPNH